MPELPEVENVCLGLRELTSKAPSVTKMWTSTFRLRQPYPKGMRKDICGKQFHDVRRRAKYVLVDFDTHFLVSHLGMTGSWRFESGKLLRGALKKHDHIVLQLSDHRCLIYNDPRRFGYIDWVPKFELEQHSFFAHLGPEPLQDLEVLVAQLWPRLQSRQTAIKLALMDQRMIVGVGNIYANEALFRAQILPHTPASQLSRKRLLRLLAAVQEVLTEAIAAGGSSISDYRKADGSRGGFQKSFFVYGRMGEACFKCGSTLHSAVLGGRTTVWCSKCQR